MRLTGNRSLSDRLRALLDGILIVMVFLVAVETLVALALVSNPYRPLRNYFNVTTILAVGDEIWPTADLVRVAEGSATASVAPMAFVTFRPGEPWFVLAVLAVSLLVWACYFLVVLQLRGVCANLALGPPFSRDNIRRVRRMGWAFIGVAAANLVIDASMVAYQHAFVTVAGRPPSIPGIIAWVDFPLGTILAGLAFIALAEIFRAGADLQDDQALTI
jgi:hypothetical protein